MFTSIGVLHYDPKQGKNYDPWWALLECDEQIADYYSWQLKKFGVEVWPNSKGLWGTHVSVLKGEPVPNPEAWAKYEGYQMIRYDNGKHAWVDVYSEHLSTIRMELGFPEKFWYHLTVGRLAKPW